MNAFDAIFLNGFGWILREPAVSDVGIDARSAELLTNVGRPMRARAYERSWCGWTNVPYLLRFFAGGTGNP